MSERVTTRLTTDAPDASPIPFGPALGSWAAAWIFGSALLAGLVIAAMGNDLGDDLSIGTLAVVSLVGWASFLTMLVLVSRRYGTGDLLADLAVAFRPIDLVGVPIGVALQLVVVQLLYWPLRRIWPDTFSTEAIEERAQDLADRADGIMVVVLVLVVVVGAPIVEELVYRGLLQRSLSTLITPWPALLFVSLGFAFIHFSWVEIPGLFVAGLAFGAGLIATGRVGTSIVIHAAFNATGVAVVLGSS